MKKKLILSMAFLMGALTFTACSSSDDDNNTPNTGYNDKTYGNKAIDACNELVSQLSIANEAIASSKLSEEQEDYLYQVLQNLVDDVIVPTYTDLANDVEDLEKTLYGLTVNNITQAQINQACNDFKAARKNWELSEAFLMGAASDFDIDPTIDSWPLNRTLLLNYFNNGMNDDMLEDATILGFHALEFILFRDGKPRTVADFQSNDTYQNFEKITGAQELAYAQTICTLLKQRCFQLQVAWEGATTANANRMAEVMKAGLDYQTANGLSYGENLVGAGKNSKSSIKTLKAAIAQVLSDDEGSCVGIANEVGTAKIANPFSAGDVSYVESPYSYNSITDFCDNIRSCRNIWLGSTNSSANQYSFHTFFSNVGRSDINKDVEDSYNNAVTAIGNMPSPFVKYCCTIWNIQFEDDEDWD